MSKNAFLGSTVIFVLILSVVMISGCTSSDNSTTNNSKMSLEQMKANATNVTVEQLYSGSVTTGTVVRIYARALQTSGTDIRVSSTDDITKDVMVSLQSEASGIYEDDYVYVYGVFNGDTKYTTVMGAERKIPSIINAFIVKQ